MKNMLGMLMAVLLVMLCTAASAQEYVSVSALYGQVQAMGGVWRGTFETPNGEVTVDAPIIVPDAERLPVMTVEKAKISEELFNQIRQGKKGGKDGDHRYEVELDGKWMEFFLGRDNYYIYGEQTDHTGYDAIQTLWIQHGSYRFSQGTGGPQKARPRAHYYASDMDLNQSYARGREITVSDVMRLWQEDIDFCLGEGYVIRPVQITVNGSTAIKATGNDKANRRDGNLYITAEQYMEGFPIFGAPAHVGGSCFAIEHNMDSYQANRIYERLRPYRIGVESCETRLAAYGSTEEDYRTMTDLVKRRTVEQEDIPVCSLESILAAIEKEIRAGHIQDVQSIRLGYMLYSNPDMTDYAWAVPRWVVECEYISDGMQDEYRTMLKKGWLEDRNKVPSIEDKQVLVSTGDLAPWSGHFDVMLPIDAQSGELILITTGDEESYAVPRIITWDEVTGG